MAYPPPPGLSSLPSRPPPVSSSSTDSPTIPSSSFRSPPVSSNPWSPPSTFPPAFSGSSGGGNGYNTGRSQYDAPPTGYGVSAPPASYGAPPPYGGHSTTHHQSYRGAAATGGYGHAPTMPHIQNPFPAPGTAPAAGASDYDPEMAAAIATWQSAYVTRDAGAAGGPDKPGIQRTGTDASFDGVAVGTASYPTNDDPDNADAAEQTRKKTVAREGGGKKWTDDSLLEWDPSHLRIFVGNLGGETTDNSLLGAFSRWSSVQKARVIRDKRTNKSKGYGFVSFSDADDFFSAAKDMNGKYIGSHPVVIRKANTEIKVVKTNNDGGRGGGGRYNKNNKNKNNKDNRERNRQRDEEKKAAEAHEPSLGPINPGRITKPGQKTKNGLRLLG